MLRAPAHRHKSSRAKSCLNVPNSASTLYMSPSWVLTAVLIGLGATLLIDLWALLLRRVFGVQSLNYCLLGRWVLHIADGRVVHQNIATAAAKPHECPVGWTVHYSIGATFAVAFVRLVSARWLETPTLLPALAFGAATVLVPFLTLQPAVGLGIASSKTPAPARARLRSLATHSVFGVGLWLFAYCVKNL
jgi:hypothetical protein